MIVPMLGIMGMLLRQYGQEVRERNGIAAFVSFRNNRVSHNADAYSAYRPAADTVFAVSTFMVDASFDVGADVDAHSFPSRIMLNHPALIASLLNRSLEYAT